MTNATLKVGVRSPFLAPFLPLLAAIVMLGSVAHSGDAWASDEEVAMELVKESTFTIGKMQDHRDFKGNIRAYMRQAKAVLIFPSIIKAGLFVGGEGGRGVMLAKAENGEWSYPSFFAMGAGSFGLQVGAQRSEVMLIVLTGNGLQAILDNNVTIGGELNGAIGPYGSGAEAAVTTNFDVDVLTYAVSEGAFIGASLEGAAIWSQDGLNAAFYNASDATAQKIVIDGQFANPEADDLRTALARFHD